MGAVWTPGDNPTLKLYGYRMSHWGYNHHHLHHNHRHDCCIYPLCGTESTVVALGSAGCFLVGTRGGIVALELFGWTGGTIHPIETQLLGHNHRYYQHLSSTKDWIAVWLSLERSLERGRACEVQREWREGMGLLSGWHGRSSGKILFCVRVRHVGSMEYRMASIWKAPREVGLRQVLTRIWF